MPTIQICVSLESHQMCHSINYIYFGTIQILFIITYKQNYNSSLAKKFDINQQQHQLRPAFKCQLTNKYQ